MAAPGSSLLRWLEHHTGLRSPALLPAALLLLLLMVAVLSYLAYGATMESRLLQADPDSVAGDASLFRFAFARGSGLFRSDCAQCHGVLGKGDARLGVPDLTDKDWLYGTGRVSEIQQTVMYGIRAHDPRGRDLADMPAYAKPVPYAREKLPSLSPDDIQDVISFLLPASDKAAAWRGAQIFRGRGGCWDCHGNDAHGDNAVGAPDLTDRIWLYGHGSRADLFQSIADGHAGMCPAWERRLAPAQILEVSFYVYALAHNGDPQR
jgi:cytochrome c oxidase cbb3-type subunit 3